MGASGMQSCSIFKTQWIQEPKTRTLETQQTRYPKSKNSNVEKTTGARTRVQSSQRIRSKARIKTRIHKKKQESNQEVVSGFCSLSQAFERLVPRSDTYRFFKSKDDFFSPPNGCQTASVLQETHVNKTRKHVSVRTISSKVPCPRALRAPWLWDTIPFRGPCSFHGPPGIGGPTWPLSFDGLLNHC